MPAFTVAHVILKVPRRRRGTFYARSEGFSGSLSSRKAAAVNSQGRKPLVREALRTVSPNGAAVGWPSHCRPVGAYGSNNLLHQGLAPLAIDFRPVGPACECIKPAKRRSVGTRHGMTLVELLVVLALLVVIGSIVVPVFTG